MAASVVLTITVLVVLAAGWQRLRRLEAEVAILRDRLDAAPPPPTPAPDVAPPAPARRTTPALRPDYAADVAAYAAPPSPELEPEAQPEPAPPPADAPDRPGIESLLGARLPIWVGGAALVVAGFFLVRYSIDSGLLGPAVRVALAAIFSAVLVAAGELATRLPGLRDDPRVGQALTGAGIASAYGTLYIAVAQYALVGPGAGFALTVLVTALALVLSTRQGPPTAVMALIGGFAAPLVAGVGEGQLGALLAYLAVFIAALFALAAWRGWAWLAIAATAAGFAWANLIVVLLWGVGTSAVAGFVVALAIAATLAFPRTGLTAAWVRAVPLVLGLVQLIVFAPALDYGATAWAFHLTLAAAAVILARRDPSLTPAAIAAAALVAVLIAGGLAAPERSVTPLAAIAATALFGACGLAFSRHSRAWSWVALLGLGAPVLTAHITAPSLLPPAAWTLAELLLAAAAAALAQRHRDLTNQRDPGLVGGTALAATLAATALATLVGDRWAPAAVALVLAALGWWAGRSDDRALHRLPLLPLVAIALLAARPIFAWTVTIGDSLLSAKLTYPLLPPLADVLPMVALPTLVAAALLRVESLYAPHRAKVATALTIAATLTLYTLAKQPLAIASDARFVALGFHERAAITLALAGAGVALARRTRLGSALVALAIARGVWFDLIALNPLVTDQSVGSIPLLNTAVLLPALLAVAARTIGWRTPALALTLVATLAAVRQLTHGAILTGPMGSGENWLYSAALLLLAIAWLARGLQTGDRTLRRAALGLLTIVTIKVFLIDVAALGGVLRILSFLGLGLALIGIGWTYARVLSRPSP